MEHRSAVGKTLCDFDIGLRETAKVTRAPLEEAIRKRCVSKSFRTESIVKYMLTTINAR